MKQKFRMLTFVNVSKDLGEMMQFHERNFDAIVAGSFSQLHGGPGTYTYSLYLIRDGKVVNRVAWYQEDQLTALPKQNRRKAEEMIEEYNIKK